MGNKPEVQSRTFVVNETQVDGDTGVELQRTLALYQFFYSLAGLVLGTVCVVGGIFLFVQGVTGAAEWSAELLGLKSKVSQAAPGAILFVVGFAVVYSTKYRFKHTSRDTR
ncbi:hypothetical protein D3C85_467880 [compost metagenome]